MAEILSLDALGDVSQGAVLRRISEKGGRSYPLIQVGNIEDLTLIGKFDEVELDLPDSARYEATPGQVLLTPRGDVFHAAVIQPEHSGSVIGSNISIITPDPQRIESNYLAGLLNSKVLQRYLDRFIGGGATRSISVRQLRDFKIPVVSLDRQKRMGEAFDAYRRAKLATRALLKAQADRLEHIILPLVESEDYR